MLSPEKTTREPVWSGHLDTCITGSDFRHQLDGIGLIVLNADECLVHLYRLHQNGYTYNNFTYAHRIKELLR